MTMKALILFFLLMVFWAMSGVSQPSKWSIKSTEKSEIEQYTRSLHFLDHHLLKAGITTDKPTDFENLDEQARRDLLTEMRMVIVKEEKFWRFGKENPDMLVGSEAEVWRMINHEIVSNKKHSDPVAFLLQRVKFDSILKEDEKMRLSTRLRLSRELGEQSNVGIAPSPSQTPTSNATYNLPQHLKSPGSAVSSRTPTDPTQGTPAPSGFPIVPVAIVGAVIVGIAIYVLFRKST